jgi:hypothetical protein
MEEYHLTYAATQLGVEETSKGGLTTTGITTWHWIHKVKHNNLSEGSYISRDSSRHAESRYFQIASQHPQMISSTTAGHGQPGPTRPENPEPFWVRLARRARSGPGSRAQTSGRAEFRLEENVN